MNKPYELPENQDPNSKYVILEGMDEQNRFITTNCPKDNEYALGPGGKKVKAFVVLGYSKTIAEAQIFLFGRASCDNVDE